MLKRYLCVATRSQGQPLVINKDLLCFFKSLPSICVHCHNVCLFDLMHTLCRKQNYRSTLTFQENIISPTTAHSADHHGVCKSMTKGKRERSDLETGVTVASVNRKGWAASVIHEWKALETRSAKTDVTPNASHSWRCGSYTWLSEFWEETPELLGIKCPPSGSGNTLPPPSGHGAHANDLGGLVNPYK